MRKERNRLTRGDYMICMGMHGNGAGIGMGVIVVLRRQIPGERLPASTAFFAAGVGTTMSGTSVRPTGATAIRATGTTLTASGFFVPKLYDSERY